MKEKLNHIANLENELKNTKDQLEKLQKVLSKERDEFQLKICLMSKENQKLLDELTSIKMKSEPNISEKESNNEKSFKRESLNDMVSPQFKAILKENYEKEMTDKIKNLETIISLDKNELSSKILEYEKRIEELKLDKVTLQKNEEKFKIEKEFLKKSNDYLSKQIKEKLPHDASIIFDDYHKIKVEYGSLLSKLSEYNSNPNFQQEIFIKKSFDEIYDAKIKNDQEIFKLKEENIGLKNKMDNDLNKIRALEVENERLDVLLKSKPEKLNDVKISSLEDSAIILKQKNKIKQLKVILY